MATRRPGTRPDVGPGLLIGLSRELARRLYDPIYRNWFRVEWEGLDKIPADGGALLIANHAAALPSDDQTRSSICHPTKASSWCRGSGAITT